MYKLLIIPRAIRDLEKLPKNIIKRVHEKIISIKNNPRSSDCVKLTQEDGYRVRSGDYRILYRISNKEKIIYIYHIKHRKDTYK